MIKTKQNAQKTATKASSVAAMPVKRRADGEAALSAPTTIQNKLARLHPGSSATKSAKEATPTRKALADPNEPAGSAPLPLGSPAIATSGDQKKHSQMAKATLVLHPTSPDTEQLQRRTLGTSPSGRHSPSSLESLSRVPVQIKFDRSPCGHQAPGIPSCRRGSVPVSDLTPAPRAELSLVPTPKQDVLERAEIDDPVASGAGKALPLLLMRLGPSTNQGDKAPLTLPAEEACPNGRGADEETESEEGEVEKRNGYPAAQPKLAKCDAGSSGCQATSFESGPRQIDSAPSASCERQPESAEDQGSDRLMAQREADASDNLELRPYSDSAGKGSCLLQDPEVDGDSEPEANCTPASVPETEVVGGGSLSPVEVHSDSVDGPLPPDPQEHRVTEASGRTPLWHVNGVTMNHASISTVAGEAVGQEREGAIRKAPRHPVHSASSSSIEGKGSLDPEASGRRCSDNSVEIRSGSCPASAVAPACDLHLQRQVCRTTASLGTLIEPESPQNDKTAAPPLRMAPACNTNQDRGLDPAADLEDASGRRNSDRVLTVIQGGREIHHASASSPVTAGSVGATGDLTNSPTRALDSARAGREETAEEGRTEELSLCSGSSGGDDGLCFLSGDADFALDLERSSDGKSQEADGKAPPLTFPVLTGPDEGDASSKATKTKVMGTPAPQSIVGLGILKPPAVSPLLTAVKPPYPPSSSQPFHHRASLAQPETPAVPETPLSEIQLDGSSSLCTSHSQRPLTGQQPQQQACMAGWDAPQSIRGANWTPAVRWAPGFVPGTSPRSSEAGSNYPATLAAPVRATPRRLSMSSAFHSQTAAASSAPRQTVTTPRSGNVSPHLVLLRPKKEPPSNLSLSASCVALGIPDVVHQVPFFGNPSDAENHTGSNIVAGRRFKVPTSRDIPPFRPTYAEAATSNMRALPHCVAGRHIHHCLVPAQRPPSRAAAEDWLESRRRSRRGNHSLIARSHKGETSLRSDLVRRDPFMYCCHGS